MVESALMIAIGTVLSFITIASPWKLGGGVTVCSMLPIVILSHRYGVKAGLLAGAVYGFIQMFLGFSNVQYATNFLMAVGIVFFDYILAFCVIGLSSVFNRVIKKPEVVDEYAIPMNESPKVVGKCQEAVFE